MIQQGFDTRLLDILRSYDAHVTSIALVAMLWPQSNAPKTARQMIRNAVVRLREEGFTITSTRAQDTSGFRLVRDDFLSLFGAAP